MAYSKGDGECGDTADDTTNGRAVDQRKNRLGIDEVADAAQLHREQRVLRRTALYGDHLDGTLDKTRLTVALSQIDAWRLSTTPTGTLA